MIDMMCDIHLVFTCRDQTGFVEATLNQFRSSKEILK